MGNSGVVDMLAALKLQTEVSWMEGLIWCGPPAVAFAIKAVDGCFSFAHRCQNPVGVDNFTQFKVYPCYSASL